MRYVEQSSEDVQILENTWLTNIDIYPGTVLAGFRLVQTDPAIPGFCQDTVGWDVSK